MNKKRSNNLAPYRTALELSRDCSVPLMLLVEGYAEVLFPEGDKRSAPSKWVKIQQVGTKTGEPGSYQAVPIYILAEQWNRVFVPLLNENGSRPATWRGILPGLNNRDVQLLDSIVGPGGSVPSGFAEGDLIGQSALPTESLGLLYGCDQSILDRTTGKTVDYLSQVTALIYNQATSQGY